MTAKELKDLRHMICDLEYYYNEINRAGSSETQDTYLLLMNSVSSQLERASNNLRNKYKEV